MLKNCLPYYNSWVQDLCTIIQFPNYLIIHWPFSSYLWFVTVILQFMSQALTAWSPWERRLCFLLPFVMRVLLCGLRYSPLGGGDPASFVHVVLQVRFVLEIHHILKNTVNIILNFFQKFYLIMIHYTFNIQLINMLYSFAQCVLHNSMWHDVWIQWK